MVYDRSVHAKAIGLVKLAVEMTTAAGSGHPSSAASLAHLCVVLLYDHMRYEPSRPEALEADRLVLSEGHAAPIFYAAAADLGMMIGRIPGERREMTRQDAMSLRSIESPIAGHPHPPTGFRFFPAATGALGQGLSVAAGIAAAARLDGLDKRVYCMIGDGESREGQVWEAVDFLVDHGLSSVCPIFNCNGTSLWGPVSAQQSAERIVAKLTAWGCTARLIDGHDPTAIKQALLEHAKAADEGRQLAIVARTVKAWGMPSLQEMDRYAKPVPQAKLPQVLAELDAESAALQAHWRPRELRIPSPTPPPPRTVTPRRPPPSFGDALRRFDLQSVLDTGRWATRDGYGLALRTLGHIDARVVALDTDVRGSTRTQMFAADAELAERFFECHIAEQNMLSVAGGLALAGKIAFASTFGRFMGRALDQVELLLESDASIKLVGAHAGVTTSADGPGQMALADMAWFRAWTAVRRPNGKPVMAILNPADALAAYELTLAVADHDGPCYIRTTRPEVPFLYDSDSRFWIGGHKVLTHGRDLLVAASGYMVHEALAAAGQLAREGIRATVVDLYSVPFDADVIVELAARNQRRVLAVEDNFAGGIGAALAEVFAARGTGSVVRRMHVRRVPRSARTARDELGYLELDAGSIAQAGREMVIR